MIATPWNLRKTFVNNHTLQKSITEQDDKR